jgi:hypothetical protein
MICTFNSEHIGQSAEKTSLIEFVSKIMSEIAYTKRNRCLPSLSSCNGFNYKDDLL